MGTAPAAPIVLKFGGAAVADGAGIRRVGAILAARGGERPVAVVSAAAGVTELLLQVADAAAGGRLELDRVRIRHRTLLSQCGVEPELLNRLLVELASVLEQVRARRTITAIERDFVLSFGERMSARVVAAALRAGGRAATPVDAFDLGLISDSNHGAARPLSGNDAEIRRALGEVPGIPVVTGFVAKDAEGNLTTLGRNGSDLSASLLAEACGAREVQFWKAVGGVMSADPTLVPAARGIARLDYVQAAEYAFRGAHVLHPGALAPLSRAGIPARVLSLSEPDGEGTWIGPRSRKAGSAGAVGVTARGGATLVRVEIGALETDSPRTSELFARLGSASVEPLFVSPGSSELCVACTWSDELAAVLAQHPAAVRVERDLSLVALVGPSAGELAAARRALEDAGIEARAHWTEVGSGSALFAVAEAAAPAALRAIHAAVFEARAVAPAP